MQSIFNACFSLAYSITVHVFTWEKSLLFALAIKSNIVCMKLLLKINIQEWWSHWSDCFLFQFLCPNCLHDLHCIERNASWTKKQKANRSLNLYSNHHNYTLFLLQTAQWCLFDQQVFSYLHLQQEHQWVLIRLLQATVKSSKTKIKAIFVVENFKERIIHVIIWIYN